MQREPPSDSLQVIMRLCIHRGSSQIGGSCIEVEAEGVRLLLDLGLPLDAGEADPRLLPDIKGLRDDDPSLLGIILSHCHRDHWGLIPLTANVPLFLGAATERIMRAASDFVPGGFAPVASGHLLDGKALSIGPFNVTPYLVDHSGYDAYALLIEAGGKRLFYSGDLRSHGRKGALFERLVRRPPQKIDVMLMEGSTLGRIDESAVFATESEIEEQLVNEFRSADGIVLVSASAQNVDRIVSIYRATKRTGRTLLVDLYAAEVLHATGNPNIPQSFWPHVAFFTPAIQRVHIVKNSLFEELDRHKANRIFPEQLARRAAEMVMLFRPHMLADLERANCLANARAIWSQWDGYLENGQGSALRKKFEAQGIPMKVVHTSGHASIPDLKRLAIALNPKMIVPIHTFHGARFPELFENVVVQEDGNWWQA